MATCPKTVVIHRHLFCAANCLQSTENQVLITCLVINVLILSLFLVNTVTTPELEFEIKIIEAMLRYVPDT